jgi:hypothetical protein
MSATEYFVAINVCIIKQEKKHLSNIAFWYD